MLEPNITTLLSLVIFILAFFAIYRLIIIPVTQSMQISEDETKEVRQKSSELLHEAERLERESSKIIEEEQNKAVMGYIMEINRATEQANKIINFANEEAVKKFSEKIKELEAEKKKIMDKIPSYADEIADEIVKKILGIMGEGAGK